jgi:hypothetical protein
MLENFKGKNIKINNYIDHTYYIGGYPQRRRQCWINGNLVYDTKENIKKINYQEFQDLMNYGYKIGAYNKEYNGLDGCDMYYQFRVQ